jgi:hypothetical protein
MRPWRGLILVAAAAAACSLGPTVEHFAPASDPAGVQLDVRLSRGVRPRRLRGELVAVGDSDLLVRDSVDFWRIPFRDIAEASTRSRGTGMSLPGERISRSQRRLVQLSRYPQGVSADLLQRLLSAYGRDSVRTVP